jgi:CubicO group peptidase (beta-lactamase class C family)
MLETIDRLAATAAMAVLLAACATGPKPETPAISFVGAQPAASDCTAAVTYSEDNHGVALLVMRRGQVACEHYVSDYARDTPHALFSGTKGLNGLMAAAAAADGMLSLDELVADTLTEWKGDPLKGRMTIRHLLSLSSGIATSGPRAAPGYAEAATTPGQYPPGEHFAYGPLVFQTFGEVMRRKLSARGINESPTEYLARRVLAPIDARVAAWGGPTAGPDPNLAAGAQMSAANWAKLGDLMLRPDEARRINLDADVYEAQTKPQGAYRAYGLTWWLATPLPSSARDGLDPVARSIDLPQGSLAGEVPADLVVAAGAGGQRLYISRQLQLVVVRFADDPNLAARFQAAQSSASQSGSAAVRSEAFSDTKFIQLLTAALPNG